MNSIYNYDINDLEDYFISIDQSKFRAKQLYEWLYKKRINSFKEITNIKKEVISKLKNDFSLYNIEVEKQQKTKDVSKYLLKLHDNNKVEAVLMKHDYGNSLCISTQVGCNMGCLFCESGRLKKVRNLTAGEMVQNILLVETQEKLRVSHVVLMGIGEPFDNYENVIKFIKIINHSKAINIGARHITISTCGIIPKIDKFAQEEIGVNLAISLHSPVDEIRSSIMPINKTYNIQKLLLSINNYIKITNRRVTFEYIMLKGVNDSEKDAQLLSKLLKGMLCYVNLIPYNETSNNKYKSTSKVNILKFYDILKKNNINVTIRKEFGSNLSAACGQLRSESRE